MDGDALTGWRLLLRAKHRLRVLGFTLFWGAAYTTGIAFSQQQESATSAQAREGDSQSANTQTSTEESNGRLGGDVYTELSRATGGFSYNGPFEHFKEGWAIVVDTSQSDLGNVAWVWGTVLPPATVEVPVTVDATVQRLDIILSTYAKESASMKVRRPGGTFVTENDGAEFISVPTLQRVRLMSPQPGSWTVHITGKARFELSALGKSKVQLREVSFIPLISEADAFGAPRIGGALPMQQRLRLEVGLKGISNPVATLTLLDGTPLETVSLRPYRDDPEATRKRMANPLLSPRTRYDAFDRQTYYFGEVFFAEPSREFIVIVSGEDPTGQSIKRLFRRVLDASEPPDQGEPEPTPEDTERHRQRYYALVEQSMNNEATAAVSLYEYLRVLRPKARVALARTISNDPDAMIGYSGCQILITQGHLDEAVPPLVAMIVSGRAQTQLNGRMGYDWVHSDDDTLATRMMLRISRHLLAHFDEYDAAERRNAQMYLVGPRAPFSAEAAQRHIDEVEAKLQEIIRRTDSPTSGITEKD